ncbi:MAG: hypothetical protein R3A80_03405 [Bdellovibrionota bacterium]
MSEMLKALSRIFIRSLCAALCYGMVFTYPSWTLFGRIAHASTAPGSEGTVAAPTPDEMKVDDKPAPPPPPIPTTPANVPTPSRPKPPAAAPSRGSGHDKPDGRPVSSEGDKEKDKKPTPIPPGSSCSDDNFYMKAVEGLGDVASGNLCSSDRYNNAPVSPNCWKQVFTLLGAAQANANAIANPDSDRNAATAAADTISNAREFIPSVSKDLSERGNEDKLSRALSAMSQRDAIKDSNHQECCRALVEKARGVADYITHGPAGLGNELASALNKKDDLYKLIEAKKAQCEVSPGTAVVVPPPAHTEPPKEEKKKKGVFWAILISIGVGLLIWALTKKKKKNKKVKTRRPGGGGGTTGGTSGGSEATNTTGCETGTCGNNVGTTTAEEPPVTTGDTYPSTTGDTGRDTTTGETGGDTYPDTNSGDTGRDNTTGDGGTVTGSTTAGATTTTGTTSTGGDTYPDAGGDLDRTTSGTERTLAPKKK